MGTSAIRGVFIFGCLFSMGRSVITPRPSMPRVTTPRVTKPKAPAPRSYSPAPAPSSPSTTRSTQGSDSWTSGILWGLFGYWLATENAKAGDEGETKKD
jgi:hypothetical protein